MIDRRGPFFVLSVCSKGVCTHQLHNDNWVFIFQDTTNTIEYI